MTTGGGLPADTRSDELGYTAEADAKEAPEIPVPPEDLATAEPPTQSPVMPRRSDRVRRQPEKLNL